MLCTRLVRDANLDPSRAAPIDTVKDSDPHVAARNMIVQAADKVAGRVRKAGNPIKLSAYRGSPERPPTPDLDGRRDEPGE